MFTNVPTNVLCLSRSLWQRGVLALLLCYIAACTGEYSLDGLENSFSARRQALDELRVLATQTAMVTNIRGYSVVTKQFLLEGDKISSVPEMVEKFASLKIQILRMTALAQELDLKNFSASKGNSIYIMMATGGALGSSSGYIYDESKQLLKRTQKHKQIAGEQYWYVFLSS